jgi:peptide chain release factor 3
VTWPVGTGQTFQGVYDRWSQQVFRCDRADAGARKVPMTVSSLEDHMLQRDIGAQAYAQLREELALLDTAGASWDLGCFLHGEVTPVFFGSALTNFGLEPFLDRFIELAPPPRPRMTSSGELAAAASQFAGFVFKIQANMNPFHRDRVAFVRICSGRLVRGMKVRQVRTGTPLTLSKPFQFLAQDRALIEEAFSGDIIGLWDPGVLRIGDAVCEGPTLEFLGIPRFSPEQFVCVRLADPSSTSSCKKDSLICPMKE